MHPEKGALSQDFPPASASGCLPAFQWKVKLPLLPSRVANCLESRAKPGSANAISKNLRFDSDFWSPLRLLWYLSLNMASNRFGELLRRTREAQGIALRDYARRAKFDPSYISRVERGLEAPPTRFPQLARLADALTLLPGSEARSAFLVAAALDTGRLPEWLLVDENAARMLAETIRVGVESVRRRNIGGNHDE